MSDKVLMKGNEAIAEAALRSGCRHFFGYPITPQTEVAAYMAKRMPKLGGTYLQAESEVAAINMVLGASAAGVRVMTSSSSPGISLKTEGISYIAGSNLPCVILNIQRGGPGLGGIQPSQADYNQATKAPGHGDFHVIVLAPSTVQEMVDLCYDAFDLADLYRTPVIVLGDGVLGQMMEPVDFERKTARELPPKDWATNGHGFKRQKNVANSLYLQPEELERTVRERYSRYDVIKEKESRGEAVSCGDADVVIVAYGAASRIAKSAMNAARSEGLKVGCFRPVTLWPFPEKALREATANAKAVLTVEMSMGQMVDDVKLALSCRLPVSFYGRTGGVIPTPDEVLSEVKKLVGGMN